MEHIQKSVLGVTASGPRVTLRALWLALAFVGLPLICVLLLIDVLIWAVIMLIWDKCFGFWCWF